MRWGLGIRPVVTSPVAYPAAGRPRGLDSAQAAPLHARDDQDVHTSVSSCCVVIARALAAVGDSWSAALLLDGVRGWAARAAVRWDAAETGTLGGLDAVLAQALSPQQQRTGEEAAARLELDELLALPATASNRSPTPTGFRPTCGCRRP